MIIKFKLGEYKDIYEKYYSLLSYAPDIETEEEDDEFFSLRPHRIVVPGLKLSLREGMWFVHSSRCLPQMQEEEDDEEEYGFPMFPTAPSEDDEWQEQGKVFVSYDEEQEDPSKIIYYTTGGIYYTLMCTLNKRGESISSKECDELECFIDTDEFLSEDEAYRLSVEETEENFEIDG